VVYRSPEWWERVPRPFEATDATFLPAGKPAADADASSPASQEPPTIVNRFLRSTLDIGFGPTMAKAVRKLTSRGQREPQ
jgi:hypothetical protein